MRAPLLRPEAASASNLHARRCAPVGHRLLLLRRVTRVSVKPDCSDVSFKFLPLSTRYFVSTPTGQRFYLLLHMSITVLVIGGVGYIGSHAYHQLIDAGHNIAVIHNFYCGHRWAMPLTRYWLKKLSLTLF